MNMSVFVSHTFDIQVQNLCKKEAYRWLAHILTDVKSKFPVCTIFGGCKKSGAKAKSMPPLHISHFDRKLDVLNSVKNKQQIGISCRWLHKFYESSNFLMFTNSSTINIKWWKQIGMTLVIGMQVFYILF